MSRFILVIVIALLLSCGGSDSKQVSKSVKQEDSTNSKHYPRAGMTNEAKPGVKVAPNATIDMDTGDLDISL